MRRRGTLGQRRRELLAGLRGKTRNGARIALKLFERLGSCMRRPSVPSSAGNADALIAWYNAGADAQIDWGVPGDFDACVSVASHYMDADQAAGFCNKIAKSITLGSPLASGLVPFQLGPDPLTCRNCGTPLLGNPDDPRTEAAVGLCGDCQVTEATGSPMPSGKVASPDLLALIDAELVRRGVS